MNFFKLTLLLGCLLCGIAIAPSSQGISTKDKPLVSVDLGPFSVDVNYNETKMTNKLRLSKAYIKFAVNSKLPYFDNPIFGYKINKVEELIPCDNLTLGRPEILQHLDCKSVEGQILDPSYRSTGVDAGPSNNYVRRTSAKIKHKISKTLRRSNSLLYPLKNEVTQANLKAILDASKIGDLNFPSQPGWDFGYYFEVTISSSAQQMVVKCEGEFYLTVNRTSYFVRFDDDDYPEFMDEINYLYQEASENGYLLSIKNVTCGPDPSAEQFTEEKLVIDFTVAQKQTFPYLTLRHITKYEPSTNLMNYDANITQVRDPASIDPNVYNTLINIDSRSQMYPLLNIKLEQTFANEGLLEGFEKMVMSSLLGSISVTGKWGPEEFSKLIQFRRYDEAAEPFFEIANFYRKDDDMVTLSFRLARKTYDSWMQKLKELSVDNEHILIQSSTNDTRDEL